MADSPVLAVVCCLALAGGGAWAEDPTITVHAERTLRTLSERFSGSNFVALWNPVGASAGAQAAVKELGLGHLRFPGGVPCQWWDWEDPTGSGWTTITTDDAWRLACASGAELLLQTNTATTKDEVDGKTGRTIRLDPSPEHQAAWLRWCRAHGMKVAWWEIGNEPEMDAPQGIKGDDRRVYDWYNGVYGAQAKALRAVDPQVRLLGPAATNEWFWWAQGNLGRFLAAHGDKGGSGLADGISLHWYPENAKGPWEKVRGSAQHWQQAWDSIQAQIRSNDSRALPVFVTEWNWAGGQDNGSARSFANALGCADIVGMFRRTGVFAHSHFCLQNIDKGWGVLGGSADSRPVDRPSPTFFALALGARLGRGVLALDNPADEANALAAYAGRDEAGAVRVLLINKTDAAQRLRLALTGMQAAKATLDLLAPERGAGLDAETVLLNGQADPELGAWPPAEALDAAAPLVELPPYGLAVATFTAAR